VPPDALERYLGTAAGRHLAELSRGIDDRPVVPEQEAKSIGHEETFTVDLWDRDELQRRLHRMVDASASALRGADRSARTVTVKLRFGDFTQITRSHTLDGPVDATPAIATVAAALLDGVDLAKGVRLLGVTLSGLAEPGGGTQLRLDLDAAGTVGPSDGPAGGVPPVAHPGTASSSAPRHGIGTGDGTGDGHADPEPAGRGRRRAAGLDGAVQEAAELQETWRPVTDAVDAIRARYGGESVGPASLVTPEGLKVKRRGEAQWGPTAQGREPPPSPDRHAGRRGPGEPSPDPDPPAGA
jgi:hypothetical protein